MQDLQQANMKTRETMVNLDKVLETIITRHTKIALKCVALYTELLIIYLVNNTGNCVRVGYPTQVEVTQTT